MPKRSVSKKTEKEFPVTCTMRFKSQEDMDLWTNFYINHGEQHMLFYTQLDKSVYEGKNQVLVVAPNEDEQCPECKYVGDFEAGHCGNCDYDEEDQKA